MSVETPACTVRVVKAEAVAAPGQRVPHVSRRHRPVRDDIIEPVQTRPKYEEFVRVYGVKTQGDGERERELMKPPPKKISSLYAHSLSLRCRAGATFSSLNRM